MKITLFINHFHSLKIYLSNSYLLICVCVCPIAVVETIFEVQVLRNLF